MKKHPGTAAYLRIIFPVLALPVSLCTLWLFGCSEKNPSGTTDQTETSKPSVYTIPSGSNASVADTVTGGTLIFPGGNTGTVTVAKITGGANQPATGTLFSLVCPAADTVLLRAPSTGLWKISGFGQLQSTADDSIGSADRWVTFPAIDSTNGKQVFSLTLPPHTGLAKKEARRRIGSHAGFSQFWMTQIAAGSTEETRLAMYNEQVWQLIRRCLDTLDPAIRPRCDSAANGRLKPNIIIDGKWYDGFGFRFPGVTPSVKPVISFTTNATQGNMAHETGHYLNHVLAGDAKFLILQDQDPGSNHGLGTPVAGRAVILEDYAYFFEYFFKGTVGGLTDPTSPRDILRGNSPLVSDFPGIEGFGVALLAACQRASPEILNIITGKTQKVPVVNMSFRQLLGVVATGPTSIDQLRSAIEATMTPSQALNMPALCQSLGWYYGVTGKIVNQNGTPLAGLKVASISRVDKEVYEGGSSAIVTNADGSFSIPSGVFPGSSLIRTVRGTDTGEIPVAIEYTEPTTKTIDLGVCTLKVAELSLASVKPDSATAGSVVTLRGTAFGTKFDSCKVLFGATAVSNVELWGDSLITVRVPVLPETTMLVKVQIPGRQSNPVLFKVLPDLLSIIKNYSKCAVFIHGDMKFSGTTSYHAGVGDRGKLAWTGSAFTATDTVIGTNGEMKAVSIGGEIDPAGRVVATATLHSFNKWIVDDTTSMETVTDISLKNIPFMTKVDSLVLFKRGGRVILDSNLVSASVVQTKFQPSGSTVMSRYEGYDLTLNNAMDVMVEFDKVWP